MRCCFLLPFLVLGIISSAYGDEQGTWTNYTYTNEIYDISVFNEYVWCATKGGVVRWDTRDSSYTIFTTADGLLDNWVWTIHASNNSDIWCGLFSPGICHFDGVSWESYQDPVKIINQRPVIVTDLKGTLWMGSHNYGLFRFDGKDWKLMETTNDFSVYSLDVAPDGTVWGGFGVNDRTGEGGGLGVYDYNGRIAMYTTDHGLGDNVVSRVAVGKNGDIWCVSGGRFISRLDGESWTTYDSASFMEWGGPRDIAVSGTGEVWIARWGKNDDEVLTYGKGVVRYGNGIPDIYTSEDGLAHDTVWAVDIDDADNAWFGTDDGLSVFDGDSWRTFGTGIPPNIRDIVAIAAEEDGAVWCGTKTGVLRYENNGFSLITTADGLADNAVNDIEIAPNGAVWFGTLNGVSRFDGNAWTTYTHEDGLVYNEVACLHFMPDGVLWVGTRGGVSRFDGKIWTSYDENDGLSGNYVTSIDHTPNGDIWFGTYQHGATRFNGISWEKYTTADGLLYNTVVALAVDHDGNIWFAVTDYPVRKSATATNMPGAEKTAGMYPGAVIRYDGEKEWVLYTYRDGLPSDWVTAIDVAANGDIWFSTLGEGGYGVSRYDGDRMTIYTASDGLANNQVMTLHVAPDGRVYFGTHYGLSIYNPEVLPVNIVKTGTEPTGLSIIGNYPNPFNPVTTISFWLPETGRLKLDVFAVTGAKVATLADGVLSAGEHSVTWNASGFPSGVYFYRLRAGEFTGTGKMLLVK